MELEDSCDSGKNFDYLNVNTYKDNTPFSPAPSKLMLTIGYYTFTKTPNVITVTLWHGKAVAVTTSVQYSVKPREHKISNWFLCFKSKILDSLHSI